ncbi:MAG: response regulator [Planctomycetes bacterium]|nr:response regulator [Planctomycetota bacterium]
MNSIAIEERLSIAGLSSEDLEYLEPHAERARAALQPALDRFYEQISAMPEIAPHVADDKLVERLRGEHSGNVAGLFSPTVDDAYVASRLRIGERHFDIRLAPQWYITGYGHVLTALVDSLLESGDIRAGQILIRRAMFDMALVLDAYGFCAQQQLLPAEAADPTSTKPRNRTVAEMPRAHPRESYDASLARIRLSTENATTRRHFLGLDDVDIRNLNSLEQDFDVVIPDVLDNFYAFVRSHPRTVRMVPDGIIDRLRTQVHSYWMELTRATFDRPYAASRLRIGVIHERIGLSPQWYLAGLARQLCDLIQHLSARRADYRACVRSLIRSVLFDASFAIDAYLEARLERLLRSDGYASALVASMTAGVAIVDSEGLIVSVNSSLLGLLSVDGALLAGMPVRKAIPIPRVADLSSTVAERHEERVSELVEYRQRSLRITAFALDSEAGPEDRVAIVVDDVTELRHLARDIDDSANLANLLVSDGPAVVWAIELPTWTTLAVSRQIVDLTGCRNVSLIGRDSAFLELLTESDRDRFRSRAESLAIGEDATFELRLKHMRGHEVWTGVLMRRLEAPGGRSVLAGTFVDYSSSRRHHSARIEEIGRLAGGVAHAVNNSLTVILGELSCIRDGDAEPMRSAERALEACERATAVTKGLLAFARRQPLRATDVDLRAALRALVPMLRARIEHVDSVVLDIDVSGDPIPVRIDVEQLGAALSRIIDNAKTAMPHGGSITIGCRRVAPCTAEVIVRDDGTGMSEDVLASAFDPFFTTTCDFERGLGLSVVLGFFRQSGGQVRIESTIGKGTSVRIELPILAADSPETSFHASRLPVLLVVEDNETVREVVVRVARARGFEAIGTPGALEALKILDERSIDAMIIDIVLGTDLDGIALADMVRMRHADMPILLTSGYAAGLFGSERNFGAYDFLPKPFSPEALERALRKILHEFC